MQHISLQNSYIYVYFIFSQQFFYMRKLFSDCTTNPTVTTAQKLYKTIGKVMVCRKHRFFGVFSYILLNIYFEAI